MAAPGAPRELAPRLLPRARPRDRLRTRHGPPGRGFPPLLDSAGIRRAVCAVNPLREYAHQEIVRCSADPRTRHALKLHFGTSDVDLERPEHVQRVREVFRAANAHGMAVIVHMHPSVCGAGRADEPAMHEALDVFTKAIAERDPRMKSVYFDISGMSGCADSPELPALIATRVRQLGVGRVRFGSNGAVEGNSPLVSWKAFRKLPLSADEFRTIEGNVPPYMR
jgi:uncharacterized protein